MLSESLGSDAGLSGHISGSQCWPRGPQGIRFPSARSTCGPLVFFNREQVAVQRRGVTAGTEVRRCLRVVGRLNVREGLCV